MNNAVATPTPDTNSHFNEAQWLQVLFLLADTQCWLQQLQEQLIWQLPVKNRRKLLRKSWYLSAKALAHILERHYYKVAGHPFTGKFTISIPQIVAGIRNAGRQPPEAVPCSTHLQRVWDAGTPVGYDPAGNTVTTITVIATITGEIMTAFPGRMPPQDL